MSIVLDTVTYNLPLKTVNRKAEILFKDGAGRTADGVLHAEAIGTFMNYDCEVGMSKNNSVDYAAFWLAITEPTAEHEITLPDESGTLTFDCYFANIKDTVMKWNEGGTNYFKNLSFSVIATSPARVPA
jgi:hypothetical protein